MGDSFGQFRTKTRARDLPSRDYSPVNRAPHNSRHFGLTRARDLPDRNYVRRSLVFCRARAVHGHSPC